MPSRAGDGIASEYDWALSPSALNQFRFGYTRRSVDQTSLQNGGITIPGAPVSTFPSTLPIFTVTGFQQIGPTSSANTNFKTSVTEFLDTFSAGSRTPHHQVRDGSAARGPGYRESGESHRLVRIHHHGLQLVRGRGRQRARFPPAGVR